MSWIQRGNDDLGGEYMFITEANPSATFESFFSQLICQPLIGALMSGFFLMLAGQHLYAVDGEHFLKKDLHALSLSYPTSATSTKGQKDDASSYAVPRIVGGQPTQRTYPWMVSVQVPSGLGRFSHICGGVLIDARTVITAAHCVSDQGPARLRLAVGERDLSRLGRDGLRTVKEIVIHPQYNQENFDNDLALLRLAEPVTSRQPLALPPLTGSQFGMQQSDAVMADLPGEAKLPGVYQTGHWSESGATYRILGWGATDSAGTITAVDTLREANLQVYSQATCQAGLNGTTFCAGERDGSVDSCLGDSGGPLLRIRADGGEASYELMGLVSYGNGEQCAQQNVFGFYTDVQRFLPFINGVTTGRDHWMPFRWVGLNYPTQVPVEINNYSSALYLFDFWSGAYEGGVQIQANDCEQASLAPAQSCALAYQLSPEIVGAQTVTTALPFVKSEDFGAAEAAEKRLISQVNVLPPFNVGRAFQVPGVTWFSGGDHGALTGNAGSGSAIWVQDPRTVAAGETALRSAPVGDNQRSVLQGYFEGPREVEAYVLVDSEEDFDFLVVTVDEEEVFRGSGYTGWRSLKLSIPRGGAIVRFDYVKDSTANDGRDAAWVDFVSQGDDVSADRFLVDDRSERESGPADNSESGGSMSVYAWLMMVLMGGLRPGARLMNRPMRQSVTAAGACALAVFCLSGCAGNPEALSNAEASAGELSPASSSSVAKTESSAAKTKNPGGDQFSPVAEPLYSKQFDGRRLTVQVRSLGCTQASSFRLVESSDKPGWFTVERIKPDYCRRAPMIMTVTVPISESVARRIAETNHPKQIRLTNVEVPSVGLPVIPPVVNP